MRDADAGDLVAERGLQALHQALTGLGGFFLGGLVLAGGESAEVEIATTDVDEATGQSVPATTRPGPTSSSEARSITG